MQGYHQAVRKKRSFQPLRQSSEEKRKLMNLLISNPVFDGETIDFPLVLAFEYSIKLHKLETRGVSWSLAFNGNSAICSGFSTLTNRLQPQLAPARPPDKTSSCRGSQFHKLCNKKGLPKAVLFYYWSEQSSEQQARFINIINASLIFVNSLLN